MHFLQRLSRRSPDHVSSGIALQGRFPRRSFLPSCLRACSLASSAVQANAPDQSNQEAPSHTRTTHTTNNEHTGSVSSRSLARSRGRVKVRALPAFISLYRAYHVGTRRVADKPNQSHGCSRPLTRYSSPQQSQRRIYSTLRSE